MSRLMQIMFFYKVTFYYEKKNYFENIFSTAWFNLFLNKKSYQYQVYFLIL